MKVYVLKYWRSKGIMLLNAEQFDDRGCYVRFGGWYSATRLRNEDYAKTWPEALQKLELKRSAAIRTAERQISRLRALTFEEPTEP